MHVSLTPYLEALVEQKVATGRYNNASEVVREALRLMEARDLAHDAKLRDLRAAIDDGFEGPPEEWNAEDIIREGRARRAARVSPPTERG